MPTNSIPTNKGPFHKTTLALVAAAELLTAAMVAVYYDRATRPDVWRASFDVCHTQLERVALEYEQCSKRCR